MERKDMIIIIRKMILRMQIFLKICYVLVDL